MKRFSKLIAVVASAIMVMAPAMSAAAAPSVATASATATDVSAVTASAGEVAVTVSAVSEAKVAEAQNAIATVLTDVSGSLQVEKCFELTAVINGPTDISIAVPGVTAGQKVYILHQKADGAWENIPVKGVSAGSVTGTFTSLSPVAIVTSVSPKTGETAPILAVICVIAVAGAAVCAKKFVLA